MGSPVHGSPPLKLAAHQSFGPPNPPGPQNPSTSRWVHRFTVYARHGIPATTPPECHEVRGTVNREPVNRSDRYMTSCDCNSIEDLDAVMLCNGHSGSPVHGSPPRETGDIRTSWLGCRACLSFISSLLFLPSIIYTHTKHSERDASVVMPPECHEFSGG